MFEGLANHFYNGFKQVKALNKKRLELVGRVHSGIAEAQEHVHMFKHEIGKEIAKSEHVKNKAIIEGRRRAIILNAENNINEFNRQHPQNLKRQLTLKNSLIHKREQEIRDEQKARLKIKSNKEKVIVAQKPKIRALKQPNNKTITFKGSTYKLKLLTTDKAYALDYAGFLMSQGKTVLKRVLPNGYAIFLKQRAANRIKIQSNVKRLMSPNFIA